MLTEPSIPEGSSLLVSTDSKSLKDIFESYIQSPNSNITDSPCSHTIAYLQYVFQFAKQKNISIIIPLE